MEQAAVQIPFKQYNLAINTLHPGLPFEQYVLAEGVNASGLKKILRSPSHFQASLTEPDEPTDNQEFGKLLHFIVLEPEVFEANAKVRPKFDLRTKVGKAGLAEWQAAVKPGDIVVPEEHLDELRIMRDRVYAQPAARRLLERGIREGTFWWEDPATGLLCKARPDFVSATGIIVDLKSAVDASYEGFQRALWNYRYDLQAAHYCAGAGVAKIARPDAYAYLVIEKEPPYAMAIYTCGVVDGGEGDTATWSVLGCGAQWREEAMRIYKRCQETNTWPGYQTKPQTITMPKWAKGVGEQ